MSDGGCPYPFSGPPHDCEARTFSDDLGAAWTAYQVVQIVLAAVFVAIALFQFGALLMYRYWHAVLSYRRRSFGGDVRAVRASTFSRKQPSFRRSKSVKEMVMMKLGADRKRQVSAPTPSETKNAGGVEQNTPPRTFRRQQQSPSSGANGKHRRTQTLMSSSRQHPQQQKHLMTTPNTKVRHARTASMMTNAAAAMTIQAGVANVQRARAVPRKVWLDKMCKWDTQLRTEALMVVSSMTYLVRSLDPFSFRNSIDRSAIEILRTLNGCVVMTVLYWVLFGLLSSLSAVSDMSTAQRGGSRTALLIERSIIAFNWVFLLGGVIGQEAIGPLWIWDGVRLLVIGIIAVTTAVTMIVHSWRLRSVFKDTQTQLQRNRARDRSNSGRQRDKSQANTIDALMRMVAIIGTLTVLSGLVVIFRSVALLGKRTDFDRRPPSSQWSDIIRLSLVDHFMYVGLVFVCVYFGARPPSGEFGELLRDTVMFQVGFRTRMVKEFERQQAKELERRQKLMQRNINVDIVMDHNPFDDSELITMSSTTGTLANDGAAAASSVGGDVRARGGTTSVDDGDDDLPASSSDVKLVVNQNHAGGDHDEEDHDDEVEDTSK
eukprot:TRINITY_DN54890_c0_g1_i1.p2 TRINITY_DN54890_c0_g1~~TRINITY_DN54890_c0_g1_i1.p2  ORF type:complete len:602 (+),score=286.40 TRINITY_DN54890_c0_g1_i1:54-1859(+)